MSYEFGAWQAAEANYNDAMAALERANATIRRQNARIANLDDDLAEVRTSLADRDATIANLTREAQVRTLDLARSRAMLAAHSEAASVLATVERAEAHKGLPATADLPIRTAIVQRWIAAHAKAASATPCLQIGRAQDIAGDIPWLFPDEASRAAFKKGVEDVAARKRQEAEQARMRSEQAAEAARVREEQEQAAQAAARQEAMDRAAARRAAKADEDRATGLDRLLPLVRDRTMPQLRGILESLASEPRKGFMTRKWSVLGVNYASEEQADIAKKALHSHLVQTIKWGF